MMQLVPNSSPLPSPDSDLDFDLDLLDCQVGKCRLLSLHYDWQVNVVI